MSGPDRSTVDRAYLVCASQRSGSTLLVESLRITGAAGRPAEFFEYLPDTSLPPQSPDWFVGVHDPAIDQLLAPVRPGRPDTRDAHQWRADVRAQGTGDNGVWGGKLMWNQTTVLCRRVRDLLGGREPLLREAVHAVLDVDPVWVYVHRADVAGQAVSMWRAVQTQSWTAGESERDSTAEYHLGAIAHLAEYFVAQQRAWEGWFAREGIDPVRVEFDELVADPTSTTGRVLDAIGLDPRLAPPPPLRRQGDARSREWVARYREEAAEHGYPVSTVDPAPTSAGS
ncbi:trehalose 2-sulfotransferase [Williamsia deligens]|uniref:Trehalose 2-sulfotransferase n=1 Tax=Williamsia deligens TaxID=321325 RepID=A0ABW3GCY5_9NOCA|nr:Stf0 family sulfotransferase [Williamsia deligens]MCP2192647.1 LPS sulfotransferase NodH [Williamsia deligens]